MKFFLNLIFLNLFFFLAPKIQAYVVNCDEIGRCYVTKTENITGGYILPGMLPLTPEKNISPSKNVTSIPVSQWDINQKPIGISVLGYLAGSTTLECTGGINECYNGCCNEGKCSDPVGICVRYENRNKLVILITGFVFLLLLLFYWTAWYLFGVIWNAKPKILKSDNIYIRFAPPKITISNDESEKSPTSRGDLQNNLSTGKLNKYNYEEKTDREENKNLMSGNLKEYKNKKSIPMNENNEELNADENPYSSNRNFLQQNKNKNEIIYEEEYNTNTNNNNNVNDEFNAQEFNDKYSPNHITNKWMNAGGENIMDAIPEESFKSSTVEIDSRKKLGESIFRRNKTNKTNTTTNNNTKVGDKIGNARNNEIILENSMQKNTREDVFNVHEKFGDNYITNNNTSNSVRNDNLIVNTKPALSENIELGKTDIHMNAMRIISAYEKDENNIKSNTITNNNNQELIQVDDKGLKTNENLKVNEKKEEFYDWMFN